LLFLRFRGLFFFLQDDEIFNLGGPKDYKLVNQIRRRDEIGGFSVLRAI
jgi:hypothetical protein